ncbi:MAG: SDR family oxidoreductase [Clostridiaceae bacterium]|nr:SDR family oxidoreductase [Clostridiaceae bacterium]
MINLRGKWAFITGASRGLGYQMAQYLADQGCHLVLHSRSLSGTSSLSRQLEFKGIQTRSIECDLSSVEEVESMLKTLDEMDIVIDVVFNNAGLQIGYHSDFLNTPIDDFEVSFKVNTVAPAMISYHFLKQMKARGFGRIINTTSGIQNEPEQAGYSASKAALDKFTMDIGGKFDGTDVMIAVVDPGWCRTDMGGPNAPNPPESALPGMVVGAFADDKKSPRYIRAQDFSGLSLEDAVKKLQLE